MKPSLRNFAASLVTLGLTLVATDFTPALAQDERSPWMVRVRGLGVVPDVSASVSPIGGSVTIDDSYVGELDITYFFTDHISAELILAVTPHDVAATVGPTDLGSVWLLPPTLLAQYHFLPDEKFNPYVGVGVNYTVFFEQNAPGGAITSVDYSESFGWALQAGVDIEIRENWYFNVDLKKVFLDTDVSINGGAITAAVDIDPWIVGLGFGYRF